MFVRNVILICAVFLFSTCVKSTETPRQENETGGDGAANGQEQQQMLPDSTAMQRIAAEADLRRQMLERIINEVKGDSAAMAEVLKTMLQDEKTRMLAGNLLASTPPDSEQGSVANDNDDRPEIIVKLKPEAQPEQVNEMESEIGLRQVKEIRALRMKVYQVVSDKSVAEAISACEERPFVEYAEPNQEFRAKE